MNARFDPHELRAAFGSFPTGVTVVTTRDANGDLFGFTANSFSSVSLDPPMLLVCPGRFLSSFHAFETCKHFAVNVLAEGQEDASNIFASFKGDRFSQVTWRADSQGVPLIEGVAAHFSCQTAQVIPAGDHIILLGEVLDFDHSGQNGLGYAAGSYFSLELERRAATAPRAGADALVGALIETDGMVLLEAGPNGLRPPQFDLSGKSRVRDTLHEHLSSKGLDAELIRAFSVFDDRQSGTRHTYFLAKAEHSTTALPAAPMPA